MAGDVFYSSFLLRLRWDRDQGILDGEIQRVPTSSQPNPPSRRFVGLDVERIVDFIRENLDSLPTHDDGEQGTGPGVAEP
jgi:hypothetical protein